ncbi:hypothetical protein OAS39_02980 [Pirellulales bacterium]|nr:hypothetical protein [Pirellulales bacterium]
MPGATLARGFSEPAKYSDDAHNESVRFMQKSSLSGTEQLIRGELAQVFQECSEPDWGGDGSLPITHDAYGYAEGFLRALPFGFPLPSVGPDPRGLIAFDWDPSDDYSLTVTIGPDGDMTFAAHLGTQSRRRGSEFFDGDVPIDIRKLIEDLYD